MGNQWSHFTKHAKKALPLRFIESAVLSVKVRSISHDVDNDPVVGQVSNRALPQKKSGGPKPSRFCCDVDLDQYVMRSPRRICQRDERSAIENWRPGVRVPNERWVAFVSVNVVEPSR
jgi:hypothetical protein